MELSFATKSLRSECLDADLAATAYGPDVAAELKARLADLDAAVTPGDLPQPGGLRVSGRELRFTLAAGWDLVCEPGGAQDDGALDWTRVYRLKLVRIEGE